MNKLMINPEFNLYERNEKAFCSSRQVAEAFDRRHDNVLQDIANLDCSIDFTALNFQESKYKDSTGKRNKEFLMTKDGFVFLVMGYRGKKAAKFKEEYINRFNNMEAFIKNLCDTKAEFPEFAQAIMDSHEEPKNHHYSNELNMINKIVLGMNAKQFKDINDLGDVPSIRPYLTSEQIESIRKLQRVDIGLIVAIPSYDERKRFLTDYYNNRSAKRISA